MHALLVILSVPRHSRLALKVGLTLLYPSEGNAVPSTLSPNGIHVGPFSVTPQEFLLAAVGFGVAGLIVVFLRFTQTGRSMRALAENPGGAALMGVNPRRLSLLGWGISGSVAALAGAVISPGTLIDPTIGGGYLFIVFAAAVLGGFGSIGGALAGGLIIGIAQEMFGAYISEGWSSIVAFALLVVVLLVRPQGLFGFSVDQYEAPHRRRC